MTIDYDIFGQYSDVVTVKELCEMLKVGRNTAYALLNNGSIRSVRIGRRFLVPKQYIIAYLNIHSDINYNGKDL